MRSQCFYWLRECGESYLCVGLENYFKNNQKCGQMGVLAYMYENIKPNAHIRSLEVYVSDNYEGIRL